MGNTHTVKQIKVWNQNILQVIYNKVIFGGFGQKY